MARQKASPQTSIAERLTSAREAVGLTTAQLARRLGVRSRTLSSWEAGKSVPRANRLFMLAGMLDVTPAWLIGGEGTVPPGGRDEVAVLRGELKRLRTRHEETGRLIGRLEAGLNALARKIEQQD